MRIRRNVKDLTPPQKTAFANAVLALKNKPSVLHPGDPNFSRYDDYAEIHMNAMMANPGWAHRGSAFCPWHRELILQFENDLNAIDSSVTLPYWDWTDPNSLPFTVDFLGGNGVGPDGKVADGPFAFDGPNHWTIKVKDNPGDPDFLQRNFGADPTATALPTQPQVNAVLGVTPYDNAPWQGNTGSFRSQLERDLHNLVHRWVGGTMGNMTSPNDPVFFLHHCNIDRLWMLWQQQNPTSAPYLPPAGAPPGQNLHDDLIFSAGPPAPWPGAATPESVIDNLALGYTYDAAPVRVPRIPLTVVRILFGVTNDAPGVVIGPDGKPHPVPGGPGDPVWSQLSPAVRDRLLGSAVHEIAGLVNHATARAELQKLAAQLVGKRVRTAGM